MKPLRAVVVEDEGPARRRLMRMLEKHPEFVEVIAEAKDGEEGLQKIESLHPDLIFLDIQMPGLNGFQLLDKLEEPPMIIFTTAYERYALRAFHENSIDYLLKPFESEDLKKALEKAHKFKPSKETISMKGLLDVFQKAKPSDVKTFPVKVGDRIILVKFTNIAFFKADDKYVQLFDTAGKQFLVDESLRILEKKLPSQFIRVHRSFVVNKNKIKELIKYFSNRYILVIDDDKQSRITTGKTYAEAVKVLTHS